MNRYHVRLSWRLFGALLIGLLWGSKAASLIVNHYSSSIEPWSGTLGLWTAGITIATTIAVSLGILIDWAYWFDEAAQANRT